MNTFQSLLTTSLIAVFLGSTVAHAQLKIGRQPQADGRRTLRAPANPVPAIKQSTKQVVQPPTSAPSQVLTLLEELDQAYANHALLMQNVLTQVPPAARTEIQSAIRSAEQSRRMIAVRRKQMAQTPPRANPIRKPVPTATGSPTPSRANTANGNAGVAKPGLQMKREARQKAAIEHQKTLEKTPVRRFRSTEPQ